MLVYLIAFLKLIHIKIIHKANAFYAQLVYNIVLNVLIPLNVLNVIMADI